MKKIFLFLLPFFFSTVILAQNQDFKGFYQARFVNILENVNLIEAEFEIKGDNSILGTVKLDDKTETLRGTIEPKGKFEIKSETVNNYTIIIKGDLSSKNADKKISLVRRFSEKTPGNKRVSENSISGFVSKTSPPTVVKEPETASVNIADNGKTQLLLRYANPLFGSDWKDFPATVKIGNSTPQTTYETQMKIKSENEERWFRFFIVRRNQEQKIWLGKDVGMSSYGELKKSADGSETRNFFLGTKRNILSGQIEIVGENEREMIFKITNYQIKRHLEEDSITIDGYIYAEKKLQ